MCESVRRFREKTIAEGEMVGIEKGKVLGREEGKVLNARETLENLLHLKFGNVSEDTAAMIEKSALEQVNHIINHIFDIQKEKDVIDLLAS